jgi:hypothetical protein
VRALRVELLSEHLGIDTAGLDIREAMEGYRDIAAANRLRKQAGEPLQGLAHTLDPAVYGA